MSGGSADTLEECGYDWRSTHAVPQQLECSTRLQLGDFLAATSLSFLRNKILSAVALGIHLL